jgi:RNase P/RNase MRP subunit p30
MAVDIVFPEGNEEKFMQMAEKLGYKSLVFCYASPKDVEPFRKKTSIKILSAIMVDSRTAQKMKGKADLLISSCSGDIRQMVEATPVDILIDAESSRNKDFIHHRNSGLNHIIANLASAKKKAMGFSGALAIGSRGMFRAQVMGRMMQNVRLCRKYKVKMVIASFAKAPFGMRSPHDLLSFCVILGMHPKEARDAMNHL